MNLLQCDDIALMGLMEKQFCNYAVFKKYSWGTLTY